MTIEDLVTHLGLCDIPNRWDRKAVHDFSFQIVSRKSFTSKQANLAVLLIRKYQRQLEELLNIGIGVYLQTPKYNIPVRPSVQSANHMRIEPDDVYKKVILVEAPYNNLIINDIKKIKNDLIHAKWDKPKLAWIFNLDEMNLVFLNDLAEKYNFQVDQELHNYFDQIKNIDQKLESAVPMLIMDTNGNPALVNASDHAPKLSNTTNIVQAAIEARKMGIDIWSSEVERAISTANKVTCDFLNNPNNKHLYIDSAVHGIDSMMEVIEQLFPCLVVVGHQNELNILSDWHNMLSNNNVANSEMSVLFRLGGTANKNFNQYVKDNQLNSSINDNTKVVFIGGRLPKPMIKSEIKFNCVVYFGYDSLKKPNSLIMDANQMLVKRYIERHHNVISYTDKKFKLKIKKLVRD